MNNIPPSSGNIPSKFELLTEMFHMQRNVSNYMFGAQSAKSSDDLIAAIENYRKQIESGQKHLELALLHNKYYPPPLEIEPIVRIMTDALLMLSDILQSMNELNEANKYRDEAVRLSDSFLSWGARLEVQRSLAASYTSQGRFNEALSVLTHCRDDSIESDDKVFLIRVTIDIVDILNWLGDYWKSLNELNKASTALGSLIIDKNPTQEDINEAVIKAAADIFAGKDTGIDAVNSANIYRAFLEVSYYRALVFKALKRYDEADSLFRLVLPEYEKMRVGEAIEFHIISIKLARGDYSSALKDIHRLEFFFKNNNNLRPRMASLLKLKAEALSCMSSYAQALEQVELGIKDLQENYYDPDQIWKLYYLKGRILINVGNKYDALDSFKKATDVVNDLRKAQMGYRLDSTYLEDKIPLFNDAIDLSFALQLAKDCCSLIQMIKSRALTATLSISAGKQKSIQAEDPLISRLTMLTSNLEALEFKAYRGEISSDVARSKIKELKVQRNNVLQQIKFSDPRWKNLTQPLTFNVDKINDLLSSENLNAIDLYYTCDKVFGVLFTGTKCIVRMLELNERVNDSLNVYLNNLFESFDYIDPSLYDLSGTSNIQADDFISEEFLDKALSAKGLIIVPHGSLHLISWSNLKFKDRRLFEYCPVAVLPNLSCLPYLLNPLSESPVIAIVGPPEYKDMPEFVRLEGAEKECNEIHRLYPEGRIIGEMLMGKTSTEKGFWNLVKQASPTGSIIHIACHGVTEPEEPMHSGFILGDGRIDASEITMNTLSFDEVILSACSTGWRPMEVQSIKLTGDDILGLPGAFIESGALAVLVSIPLVDDETGSVFMIQYHKFRLEGNKPMKAMQLTQKYMLDRGVYEPYKWVGFTLYGCQ